MTVQRWHQVKDGRMWAIVIGEVAASVTLLPDEKTYRTGVWSAGTGPIWYGDHYCLKVAKNTCLEAIKAMTTDTMMEGDEDDTA
jgi:hypothetical protein